MSSGSERILEAVAEVLATGGVGELSIRTVASRAGVSASQVQYYFRTKDDLVRAAFEHSSDAFLASFAERPPASLRDAVERWMPLDEARERQALVWLAFAQLGTSTLRRESAEVDAACRAWFVEQGLDTADATLLLAVIDGLTVEALSLPLPERAALIDPALDRFFRHLSSPSTDARDHPSPSPQETP